MMALKVALMADSLLGPFTGTRTFLENLIAALVAGGRVEFTLVHWWHQDPSQLKDRLPPHGWRSASIPGGKWTSRLRWLRGRASLTPRIGQHDVYLSGWQWPLGREDVPFIGIIHDLIVLDPEWQAKGPRAKLWKELWRLSVTECASRASAIISPSASTFSHFHSLGLSACCPLYVIPHGVDYELWSTPASDEAWVTARSLAGLREDQPFVLSVGQHVPRKNFIRLVQAFSMGMAADPNGALVIVGGENEATPELRVEISRLGLQDRVRLAGAVGFDQLRALVQHARVFAYPSLFEGFGIPVLEAFAAGVPVVTSSTSSLPEVAGSAAICVDPEDVSALSEALGRCWNDAELRTRMVQAGQARARTFSWIAAAEEYLKIFEVTAEESRGRDR